MPWGEPGASGLLGVAHMGFNSCVGLEPVFLKYVLGQSKSHYFPVPFAGLTNAMVFM